MSAGSVPTAFQGSVVSQAVQSHKDCGAGNGAKSHPIFDAVKAGLLIPVQTMAEQYGLSVMSARDDKGHTPVHWACLGGHTAILRYMIENKVPIDEPSTNELGARPIHWACVNGHIAIVDILGQAGVDLDATDNKNCTPLIVAAQYGQTMLAGYLMGKGARLQLTDKDGDNALHWAAFKGHNELMRLLIYSGFNPKQRDNFGQTALHLACINGNLTAVKELCEQDGVEISQADNNGKTPLQLALGRNHDAIAAYLKSEAQTRNSLIPRIDCWSIIFGPPGNSKGALLFFLFNVVIWGYPMYIFKCLPLTWNDLQIYHVLFMCTNAVMWVCLYHANTIDPGYLPRNIPEYDLAIKQVAHFDEWKQGQNPLSRLCHTCRTVKPLRAKHCRICSRCVREFDHHCPYIHNCVGYYNRAWFVAFLCALAVLVSLSDYFVYYILNFIHWDWLIVIGAVELAIVSILVFVVFYLQGVVTCLTIMAAQTLHLSCHVFAIDGFAWYSLDYVVALCILAFGFFIASCLCQSGIMHAAQNITTNERINYKRYNYLKDGKGAYYNPFDRGVAENLLEFLHLRKSLKDDEIQLLGVHTV